jgi:invasion protein IalB
MAGNAPGREPGDYFDWRESMQRVMWSLGIAALMLPGTAAAQGAAPAASDSSAATAAATTATATATATFGKWVARVDTSATNGEKTTWLMLPGEEEIGWAPLRALPALQIYCSDKDHTPHLQVRTRSIVDGHMRGYILKTAVHTRVDDQEARQEFWFVSREMRDLFPSVKSDAKLVKQLAGASRYSLELPVYNHGPATATFDVRGLGEALPQFAARCGWKL